MMEIIPIGTADGTNGRLTSVACVAEKLNYLSLFMVQAQRVLLYLPPSFPGKLTAYITPLHLSQ